MLEEMVGHPQIDIDILLKFSKAFAIDKNEALTLYSNGTVWSKMVFILFAKMFS